MQGHERLMVSVWWCTSPWSMVNVLKLIFLPLKYISTLVTSKTVQVISRICKLCKPGNQNCTLKCNNIREVLKCFDTKLSVWQTHQTAQIKHEYMVKYFSSVQQNICRTFYNIDPWRLKSVKDVRPRNLSDASSNRVLNVVEASVACNKKRTNKERLVCIDSNEC